MRRFLATTLLLAAAILARGGDLTTATLTVDGVDRTAEIYVPADAKTPLPVVFVFHGHGGGSKQVEHQIAVDRLWPEAISVYPQGLDTPGQLTDPDGKRTGWQKAIGDQGDRDLHLVDALLAQLHKDHPIDNKKIFATGHSNGGGFAYLLWKTKPDTFAAFGIASAATQYVTTLQPKPAIILQGKNDPLVRPAWAEHMMDVVKKNNGCDETGTPWQGGATIYASKTGTPLVTYLYDGGHAMDASEGGLIVKFFQQVAGGDHATTQPAAQAGPLPSP